MKKIIVTTVMICLLIMGSVIPSYAALPEDNSIMPLWDNLYSVSANFGFDTDTSEATAAGTCVRKTGVELLEGTIVVYKDVDGEWIYVAEASKSASRGSLAFGVDFTYEKGVEYKGEFTVTGYRDGVGETHTLTFYDSCS